METKSLIQKYINTYETLCYNEPLIYKCNEILLDLYNNYSNLKIEKYRPIIANIPKGNNIKNYNIFLTDENEILKKKDFYYISIGTSEFKKKYPDLYTYLLENLIKQIEETDLFKKHELLKEELVNLINDLKILEIDMDFFATECYKYFYPKLIDENNKPWLQNYFYGKFGIFDLEKVLNAMNLYPDYNIKISEFLKDKVYYGNDKIVKIYNDNLEITISSKNRFDDHIRYPYKISIKQNKPNQLSNWYNDDQLIRNRCISIYCDLANSIIDCLKTIYDLKPFY